MPIAVDCATHGNYDHNDDDDDDDDGDGDGVLMTRAASTIWQLQIFSVAVDFVP